MNNYRLEIARLGSRLCKIFVRGKVLTLRAGA